MRLVIIWARHGSELRGIVHGAAVVEHHGRERAGKFVDQWGGQRGHLDDAAQGVALTTALHAKEADGVGLVEIDRDFPAGHFAEHTVLRGRAGDAEEDLGEPPW